MRKTRLFADGHKTDISASTTYSCGVSRESVGIYFLIASLNELYICACDIGNTYHNTKCRDNIWTVAGTNFGPSDRVSDMIVARDFYGMKFSGAAWRINISEALYSIGY